MDPLSALIELSGMGVVLHSDAPRCAASGLDEASADRVAGQLDPVAHAELLEHVRAVAIDGLLADEELRGHLFARQSLRDQLDDLALPWREGILGRCLAPAGAIEVIIHER